MRNNLPFASVKSRIPPPTVSGTKTFSDAQRSTYRRLHVTTLDKRGVKTKDKIRRFQILNKPLALANRPMESHGNQLYSRSWPKGNVIHDIR